MNRPYTAPGIGWIIAIVVLIVALLGVFGVFVVSSHILLFLIIGLALALLL